MTFQQKGWGGGSGGWGGVPDIHHWKSLSSDSRESLFNCLTETKCSGMKKPVCLCKNLPAIPLSISRVQHCFSSNGLGRRQRGGGAAAAETHKLIAGWEDGNKSSRKANVENAVLVCV